MADEVIHGPEGDILVPASLEPLHADGFLLRRQDADRVLVEIVGPKDGEAKCHVIARLAFSNESFQRFVTGLISITQDGGRPAWTQSSN